MDQSNEDQVVVAGAAAVSTSNDDQQKNPPPFLKLIADCWEHIFDYLSLEEIHAMGETCKRMHQMAGYYMREYLPELLLYFIHDEIRTEILRNSFHFRTDFYQYIRKLDISQKLKHSLDADTFPSLRKLIFSEGRLSKKQIQRTRNVLKNVEKIYLKYCDISEVKAIDQLVAYCPKLTHLIVRHADESYYFTKAIFSQYIPTLEHFEYQTWSAMRYDGLKIFLEKHSNKLKSFESDYDFVWTNRDLLIGANHVQLDVLAINVNTPDIPFDQFADFLKTLHARGFYKTLHLKLNDESENTDVDHVTDIVSTLPALEIWTSYENALLIDLSRLINLTELHVSSFVTLDPDTEIDIEALAKSLMKLERLGIHMAHYSGEMEPFIRYSKKLKSIKFSYFLGSGGAIDLFALNEERKRHDACQITIYADDRVYLPTKWKSQNVNLSHIDLRRIENFS